MILNFALARKHFRALYQKASGLITSTHAEGVSSVTKAGARCQMGSACIPLAGFEPWACRQPLENFK